MFHRSHIFGKLSALYILFKTKKRNLHVKTGPYMMMKFVCYFILKPVPCFASAAGMCKK